jgi:sporulation protein YlmC with PRC-barrel domain
MMDLLRDVLDQQVIDCTDRKAGKVDGIALEIRTGAPPRVAYLDIGPDTLARRFSGRLERLVLQLQRRLRGKESEPFQVPWSRIRHVGVSVNLSVDSRDSSADGFENWLRVHIIEKIPLNAHGTHRERHD